MNSVNKKHHLKYFQPKIAQQRQTKTYLQSINVTKKFGQNKIRFHSNWRKGRDSNPRYTYMHSSFRDCPNRPLWHLSVIKCMLIRHFLQDLF